MKLKSLKIGLMAAVAALVLASCGTAPPKDPVLAYEGNVRIENQLAKAATTAAEAQQELARVQIARTKPLPTPLDETKLPAELQRPATISFSGTAQDAAMRVAAMIGYSFKVTGNPPSIPVVIQIDVKDETAAKILEDIGFQSHPFGEVAVDPNVKRVEFRYLQAQQQPAEAKGTSPSWGK